MEMLDKKQPIINVRGAKVALGPFLFEHYQDFLISGQDPEVTIFGGGTFYARSPEADMEKYKNFTKDAVLFTIFELETLVAVGMCSLRGIDHQHGGATFGISIGRKEFWGKGLGTEATKLTLEYAFKFLNLHNVKLRTASFNARGQRAYLKAGFKEMGRRREAFLLNGQRYDDIYMDCLAREFEPTVPGWIIPFDTVAS